GSVTIPATSTFTTFPTTTTAVTADSSATVTATYGASSANATVNLVAPILVSSLTCNPSSLGVNGSINCTVTLSKAAPANGVTVTLTNSNLVLTVPGSVNVLSGGTTATFAATTTTVGSNQSATVTASLGSSSAVVTINLV